MHESNSSVGKARTMDKNRRELLTKAGAAGLGLLATSCAALERRSPQPVQPAVQGPAVQVLYGPTPLEEMMREHGVVNRLLLVFDELVHKIREDQKAPVGMFTNASNLVDEFVGNYHERLEEKHIFPAFRKGGRMVELVEILNMQHTRGRRIAAEAYELAGSGDPTREPQRSRLISAYRKYTFMYRAHVAREDSVLFPALWQVMDGTEMRDLEERLKEEERRQFGGGGLDKVIETVADMERELDIHYLSRLTP